MLEKQTKFAKKAFYASIGAPIVIGRKAKEYGDKFVEFGNKLGDDAAARFETYAKEGKKVTKKLGDQKVVEEIQSKMDLEKVQTQVEKLRDQLEGVLSNWRESFAPAEKPMEKKTVPAPAPKPAAARKPAAKRAPAKKTTAKATTTTRKPAAKKAPAKKPTTTRKTTAGTK